MKRAILLSTFLFATICSFSQETTPTRDQVRIYLKGTDSSILINSIDLIGTWKSIASTDPIVGSKVPQSSIELTSGHIAVINDAWREDYPNNLRNCTWAVLNNDVQFRSPDLGSVKVELEKLHESNFFELTINNVTYRKFVNISSNQGEGIPDK
jgi:hypothetical protein